MEWAAFIQLTAGLIAILNPLGALSAFVSLTQNRSPKERSYIIRVTTLTITAVLYISAFAGEAVLHFFGISIASFQIGGGILILLMAIAMLHAKKSGAKQSKEESVEAEERVDISVVPLGIPILAGPGTISTAILYGSRATQWPNKLLLIIVIPIVSATIYLVLRFASPLADRLGGTGINIIVRVMGLILAAIAIEFITQGLLIIFPGLG